MIHDIEQSAYGWSVTFRIAAANLNNPYTEEVMVKEPQKMDAGIQKLLI